MKRRSVYGSQGKKKGCRYVVVGEEERGEKKNETKGKGKKSGKRKGKYGRLLERKGEIVHTTSYKLSEHFRAPRQFAPQDDPSLYGPIGQERVSKAGMAKAVAARATVVRMIEACMIAGGYWVCVEGGSDLFSLGVVFVLRVFDRTK